MRPGVGVVRRSLRLWVGGGRLEDRRDGLRRGRALWWVVVVGAQCLWAALEESRLAGLGRCVAVAARCLGRLMLWGRPSSKSLPQEVRWSRRGGGLGLAEVLGDEGVVVWSARGIGDRRADGCMGACPWFGGLVGQGCLVGSAAVGMAASLVRVVPTHNALRELSWLAGAWPCRRP